MILKHSYPFLNDNIWSGEHQEQQPGLVDLHDWRIDRTSKQAVDPTGEVFHVFIAIILGYNTIELTSIQERSQLSENECILEHMQSD